MGLCSSTTSNVSTKPNKLTRLSVGEANISILLAQLCDLTYSPKNSAQEVEELFKKAQNQFKKDLSFEDFHLGTITELKTWKYDQNFAITLCIELNCEPLGLTTYKTPLKVDIVAFRGTSGIMEMVQDATCFLKTPFTLKKSKKMVGDVAMGFHDAYINLRDMGGASVGLIEYLVDRAMSRDRKLIMTGHSLGGAIATLLAVEMKTDYPQLDIACITFGAPRVLSQPLAQKVNEMKFYFLRFFNQGDIICTAPLLSIEKGSGFMHCGKLTAYSEDRGKADWLVNKVSDFIMDLKFVDLLHHSLAGEKGYFNRVVNYLKSQMPEGSDLSHPKLNPKLPFASQLEMISDAVEYSWDKCVNCTDKALSCGGNLSSKLDTNSCVECFYPSSSKAGASYKF